MSSTSHPSALVLLRRGDFRGYLGAAILSGVAESALSILLGVTVYQITRDPLMLGWLGLIEAVPAIGLVLVGGHVADRFPRRLVVVGCRVAQALLAAGIAAAEKEEEPASLENLGPLPPKVLGLLYALLPTPSLLALRCCSKVRRRWEGLRVTFVCAWTRGLGRTEEESPRI